MPRLLARIALIACAAMASCSKAHHQGHGSAGIQTICGLAPDGAHERIYVGDSPSGRLVALSTKTGDEEKVLDLGAWLGGMAVDHCVKLLHVTVTPRHRIDSIDLTQFTRVSSLRLDAPCYAVLALRNDHLVVVTSNGLIDIDPATLQRTTLAMSVDPHAALLADEDSTALFVIENDLGSGSVRVSRFDLAQPGSPPLVTLPGSLPGQPTGAALDYAATKLYVASDSDNGVYVLDGVTLAQTGSIPIGPGLTAMSLNPTTTRMYVAHGGVMVDSLNLNDYAAGRHTFTTQSVQEHGLQVGANGLTLAAHESGGQVEDFYLFDAHLNGASTLRENQAWTITLDGAPDAPFFVFGAGDPGYLYLDPPSDPDPRFFDQDAAAGFGALFVGVLDATGHFEATGTVPVTGIEMHFILQAALLPMPSKHAVVLSNPLLEHLLPPECD